ncbi:MAG: hypothetical protein CFK49_11670 [Armatimonadetes bacterium JP3_11]|nr:MAG: hypothetical protein CFK49_11670 [Armatimonadetes bacterium JP3_11]RMH08089.1 MAG: hypothetical protein D6697_06970 [Armatimonadota bacterium]
MEHHDWNEIDQLAFEIANWEAALRDGAGVSETELSTAYTRLQALLRPKVVPMVNALIRDSRAAERIANEFLERVPLILPMRSHPENPCSRWIGGAVIEFVYHTNTEAHGLLSEQEQQMLQSLVDVAPRHMLSAEELDLIDRVRGTLEPDEFLVWYDYIVNGYAIPQIAELHQESRSWVEQTLQRARQKLWETVTTDSVRNTYTDVFGQRLAWLGVLRLYDHSSVAHSVANNGAVVGVAFAEEHRYAERIGNYAAYIASAFRWHDYQLTELGELGENCNPRCMISVDGERVVVASDGCQIHWDSERGAQRIIADGSVYGMNACGDILVGELGGCAVSWTNGEVEHLCHQTPSVARAVSPDGRFIVGRVGSHAVCWDTASGVVRRLGALGGEQSEALAVAWDGSVIVGKSDGRAFRWTPQTGMCALNPHEEDLSQAHSVSYDGKRVVGEALNEDGELFAFLWTEEDGLQDLNVLFAHLRPIGTRLERAYGISPHGRYIVGEGYRADVNRKEAFLIDLGELAC